MANVAIDILPCHSDPVPCPTDEVNSPVEAGEVADEVRRKGGAPAEGVSRHIIFRRNICERSFYYYA